MKFSQIFNVGKKEWPRVTVAWLLMFLSRFGFIVGWSVLIATFLSKVGINLLPVLFLVNALVVMLGTVVFRNWVRKVQREILISVTVLLAAATLLTSILFIKENTLLFFSLLVLVESVFLAQLNILISLFNEDLFTPLESQRTFPVIESAETIGAIAGGLVLSLFAELIPAYKFILLWAIAMILILPIVLLFNAKTMDVPRLVGLKAETPKRKLQENLHLFKKIPFLKGMMLIVILHWAIMNMVEFQYTKAIQQEVYSDQEQTLISEEDGHIELASEVLTQDQSDYYEDQLTQKLGTLHVIFNAAALVIQLIVTSRLIQALGVVPSMLIHPLLTLLNLVALTLKFNFTTAILTRGGYEITGLMLKNSYDSSYYAIPNHYRDEVKEVMQGLLKPFGAIIGTLFIIGIALNFEGAQETVAINVVLIIAALTMSFVMLRMMQKYTEMSEQNLSKKMDLPTRLNAIEILAQNGHRNFTSSLMKILKRKSEPEIVKESILSTLAERQDPESINGILDLIEEGNETLRMAAVKALRDFTEEEALMKRSFTAHRIISCLEAALENESNETIRENLVQCFYEFSPEALTRFLLDKIGEKSPHRDAYIRMLRLFDDPNLKYYLEPFLKDRSVRVRGAAIIALWQFDALRNELKHYLKQMFDTTKTETQLVAIQTSGEIQYRAAIPFLKDALRSPEKELVDAALLSLGQLGDEQVIPLLVDRFSDERHEWHEMVEPILKRFSQSYEDRLRHEMHHSVSKQIADIISQYAHVSDMDERTLKTLRRLYHKLNAHHEAHQIKLVLDSEKKDSI